jgi:short-subunit dehydrogenase
VGQVSLCHHFGRKMVERGRGGIILVGSLAGGAGATPLVAYCASKSFTQALAEGLWSELKPRGVDVVYLVVGAVDTPNRLRQLDPSRANSGLPPEDDPNQMPFQPEEIAQVALDHLTDGPVCVPDRLAKIFDRLNATSRAEASEFMRAMFAGFKDPD